MVIGGFIMLVRKSTATPATHLLLFFGFFRVIIVFFTVDGRRHDGVDMVVRRRRRIW